MISRTAPVKSERPCSICTKRKVKCDRLVPCSNCVKRGQEEECTNLHNSRVKASRIAADCNPELLKLWQEYDHWIITMGVFKHEKLETSQIVDLRTDSDEVDYWMEYLTMEISFKVLDYSMEKLGGLYFGCIGDIGELYLKLEEYWSRKNSLETTNTNDDHYWSAVIWSVFAMALYYMELDEISSILPAKPVYQWFHEEKDDSWTEDLQFDLYKGFLKVAIHQLKNADFMAHPDVRAVQIYLILSNTSFPQLRKSLSNSLLHHCLHVSKFLQIDNFRPLVNDSTSLRLTKLISEKLWYRLCVCDYLQSGPNKPISLHQENSSLLIHAAYLEDRPNVDVYQSEDTYELLFWKITSLDRDLSQYDVKNAKPPLKTLDAVQRQLEIFSHKSDNLEELESTNSRLEKFLVVMLINATYWKLNKLTLIHYNFSNGFPKVAHYTKLLIALVLKNIKEGNASFNKYPFVLATIAHIAGFHSYYYIFNKSAENEQLTIDLVELLNNLSTMLNPSLQTATLIIQRLKKLRALWQSVQVIDDDNSLKHPVIRVLLNDIEILSQQCRRIPVVIANFGPVLPIDLSKEDKTDNAQFRQIVNDFEQQFDILRILNYN